MVDFCAGIAHHLLISGVLTLWILLASGCGSDTPQPTTRPTPLVASGRGITPPAGFNPYLTPQQRSDRIAGTGVNTAQPRPTAGLSVEAFDESLDTLPPEPLIGSGAATAQWSIVIASFRGPQAEAQGVEALERVRMTGINGAYLERRGEAIALAYGRYSSPEDTHAQEALASLRAMDIDGQRPFASAMLAPPSADQLGGSLPQFDLRGVRARHGPDALYTLQIGVYGRSDRSAPDQGELAEYRRAAERAAIDLRRQGEQAYYFHSPQRSMVTIGVFGPTDHDPQRPGLESAALRDTRLRHPHNMLNGQGIRQRVSGQPENDPDAWRMQASALVAVPN